MGPIHIHEAGHTIAAKVMGQRVAYVWASAQQGTCMCSTPDAPFAAMVLLAAGEASRLVKTPYSIAGNPPPPAPEAASASDPTASAVATFWMETERGDGTPVLSDRDRVAALLAELVASGRIKRREDYEWRWWQRAKAAARRLLTRHHRCLARVASQLARTGALGEQEVAELWESRWDKHSFTVGGVRT